MAQLERPIVHLGEVVELKTIPDTTNRRFEVKAYTGKVIDSWFGGFVIDISGVQTKAKVPILREHARDRIVGWSEQTKKDANALTLSGVISNATADGQEVLALADEGFPWQASVGIKPLQIKQLKNADETVEVNGRKLNGPLEIWSKSLVGETSMVSWGADTDTSMRLLSEGEKVSVDIENTLLEGVADMTLEEFKVQHQELYQQVLVIGAESVNLSEKVAEAEKAGRDAERARVTEILSAGGDPAVAEKAIKEGMAPAATFKLFFQAEKDGREKALKEMHESLSESAGSSGREKGKGDEGGTAYMAEVDQYQAEKKCSRTEALRDVAVSRPELHEAYLKSLRKGE